jgi:hypothetical protein
MIDLAQAASESGVIPPEKVASLLASLKKVPDFSWLLTPPHPTEERLQGDIVSDFPIAVVDDGGNPRCNRFAAIILSNTCDLQPNRSDFVVVAPAMDFARYSEAIVLKRGEERARGFLRSVRQNEVDEILWVPCFATFREGAIIFLDRLGAAASAVYDQALKQERRLASFSQNGFYYLLIKLTNHIARSETNEVARTEV